LESNGFCRPWRRLAVLVLCGATLLGALSACRRSPSPDVMATVNGKEILRSDVEKYYQANLADNPQKPSAEQANIVRLNILSQMIEDEVLWQRAVKLNLAASDEDVNAKLTEMKAPWTQEEFDSKLKQNNMSLDDYKHFLRLQMTKTKLLNKEIESKISITDAEISQTYTEHKADFNLIEPQYHLAQIAVTSGPAQQTGNLQNNKATSDADARKKIQELQNQLESGQDFGSLAMNFSENPNTAPNGGDMGFVAESQLRGELPDVYNAVNKLKPGEITGILPVYGGNGPARRTVGYAIFKLIGREAAGQRGLNDPRVQQLIRQGLHDSRFQLLKSAFLEVLHDEAKVHNYFAEQIIKQGAQ
jgi:peptidyl-prolyl cis-trans isomerase SurA